ncbi:helix-turn-helix transcriptional regulator [Mycolicibacterium goodii]|uniref:helix-turn-helix transcriptional regulator n=1 Tax=Mycolicibacterium goodii TaxID=134601 RepID=UPI000C25B429|nr:LuxR family transcriptional regulator [Mycolicibacterium goodii]PJK20762.1 LuxR family transcriptional regulator [Mycolicibacterium goodii]
MRLIGRGVECGAFDRLLAAVRAGESRVLLVYGEPGVGKTALLDYVAEQASDCALARASGVESEMELPYAALHQLCTPMLDHLERLPSPQRDALRTAFGLTAGPVPDRLQIGLAVLSILSDFAEDRPLICLIDDLQWLDSASAQTLAFVARRFGAESVGLIIASRAPNPAMATVPSVEVRGLRRTDARLLLDAVVTWPLDERIKDQIVAETRGNPLALRELGRRFTPQALAGGFGLPGAAQLSATMEESFRGEVETFPDDTRRLLLLAAAEPTGDPALLWRAAGLLGIRPSAATPAVENGLIELGPRVRFRHPLARSAAYRSGTLGDRRLAHGALATVTDYRRDPDRRAWHRAQAVSGPDDQVADELESSANRARARGGLAAAAAFLEQATILTVDPQRRADRALAASSIQVEAGAFDAALELLTMADDASLTESQRAQAELIRAQLAYVTGRGSDAPPLLMTAARRLLPIAPSLARSTYLDALQAAVFSGRLATGCSVVEVAESVRDLPPPDDPQLADVLLDGLATYFTDGYAACLPSLRRAVAMARQQSYAKRKLPWLIDLAAVHLWDDESWDILSAHQVEVARSTGAMTELPLALSSRAAMLLFGGELSAAEAALHEVRTVTEATGDRLATDAGMSLVAYRGHREQASMLIEATNRDVEQRGEGIWLTVAEYWEAVLNNGLGNYKAALVPASRAAAQRDLGVSAWATVELVEAAVRGGAVESAIATVPRLTEMTSASGTAWALGVQSRAQALISTGVKAEGLYRDAIELLGRTRMRAELARAHLLYGEWLRRERRRKGARTQLRTAFQMFESMGMAAFADRAGHELQATGETARKRRTESSAQRLTAQEAQVARLARDGLSNPEIGARLFISPRTAQYHLGKVFAKLGISSRSQLDRALSEDQRSGTSIERRR